MIDIVLATTNDGKIREIEAALDLQFIHWLTYRDFPDWPTASETGKTFQENALHKADLLARRFDIPALADDSGLEVDALGGRPGIHSARFAGPGAVDAENNRYLLDLLKDVAYEARSGRFRCVLALSVPGEPPRFTDGVVRGHIAFEPRGSGGFGYDPLFVADGYEKTMAELDVEEKNRVSHRGRALAKMRNVLSELYGQVARPGQMPYH